MVTTRVFLIILVFIVIIVAIVIILVQLFMINEVVFIILAMTVIVFDAQQSKLVQRRSTCWLTLEPSDTATAPGYGLGTTGGAVDILIREWVTGRLLRSVDVQLVQQLQIFAAAVWLH